LEIRNNNLTGGDFAKLKNLYPNMYKIKVGENPIKSIDVFKPLAETNLRKVELEGTDAAKNKNYRDELFKILNNLVTIDGLNKDGEEVDSTIYEGGDDNVEGINIIFNIRW
jgi:hypothetical protein